MSGKLPGTRRVAVGRGLISGVLTMGAGLNLSGGVVRVVGLSAHRCKSIMENHFRGVPMRALVGCLAILRHHSSRL